MSSASGASFVARPGVTLMTLPAGTVSLKTWVAPYEKPIGVELLLRRRPRLAEIAGTGTCAGPDDSTGSRCRSEVKLAGARATGSMTTPLGIGRRLRCATVPIERPFCFASAVAACLACGPTSPGTEIVAAPLTRAKADAAMPTVAEQHDRDDQRNQPPALVPCSLADRGSSHRRREHDLGRASWSNSGERHRRRDAGRVRIGVVDHSREHQAHRAAGASSPTSASAWRIVPASG